MISANRVKDVLLVAADRWETRGASTVLLAIVYCHYHNYRLCSCLTGVVDDRAGVKKRVTKA